MAPAASVQPPPLAEPLALAERLLRGGELARGLAGPEMPAFGLPPGPETHLDRAALELFAALYFQAELEDSGVIRIAELLAEERFSLSFRDRASGELLEDFAERTRGSWYNQRQRALVFARLFGMGSAASAEGAAFVNDAFVSRLAAFCRAVLAWADQARYGGRSGYEVIRAHLAAQELLANLAERRFGAVSTAARAVQSQLAAAVRLLDHDGVKALFNARTMWDLIRAVLRTETPELAVIAARGQSGMRVLAWFAENLPASASSDSFEQALRGGRDLATHCYAWLDGFGLAPGGRGDAERTPVHRPPASGRYDDMDYDGGDHDGWAGRQRRRA